MAKQRNTHLEQKKQQLRKELEEIEQALDTSIGQAKKEVATSLNPKRLIREYPLPALGASILIGFLLGKGKNTHGEFAGDRGAARSGAKSMLMHEIKHAVARRGVHLLLDFLDQKISEAKSGGESGSS